jgi:alkylation response protein AidB-like acyl-CoA dehydrogenase
MLNAEQLEIQALAREFAAAEIRPYAAEWDARRSCDESVLAKLAELGFMGMMVPPRFGGLELDPVTFVVALEAIAWGDASVAMILAIQGGPVTELILRHGSEELRESWLPRLASGEASLAVPVAESAPTGSLYAPAIRAVREGQEWVLSGTQRWVTPGEKADAVIVFAGAGAPRGGELSALLVPRESVGMSFGSRAGTMGLRALESVPVTLESVRVSAGAVVGDPGAAQGYAPGLGNVFRVCVAAIALGIAQAAHEHAVHYAGERRQFGQLIGEFGAIQHKLAEMSIRIASSRRLTHDAARELRDRRAVAMPHADRELASAATMAKIAASETAMWVTTQAVQIFGGYGYMRDYPVEKLMRDAKGMEVFAGSNERLRQELAEELWRAELGA